MEETKVEQPVAQAAVETKVESAEQVDPEIKAREEQKANLDKAIVEANETLRQTRETIRNEKKQPAAPNGEEVVQTIDMNDPSSKAWDKHIRDNVAPVTSELEREKKEVFDFTLREFLAERPALARSPEKLREMISTFERVKSSTGRTKEGVLMDLRKAYGAVMYETDMDTARRSRIENAQEDMIISDPAISRSANSEPSKAPVKRPLSAEDRKIIEGWEANGAPKVD